MSCDVGCRCGLDPALLSMSVVQEGSCSSDQSSSLGTSICHGCRPKKQASKQTKKLDQKTKKHPTNIPKKQTKPKTKPTPPPPKKNPKPNQTNKKTKKRIWPRWERIQRRYGNCLTLSERLSCRRIRFILVLSSMTHRIKVSQRKKQSQGVGDTEKHFILEAVSSSSLEVFKQRNVIN